MFKIFKISGDSLFPFYTNGERVLCLKIFKKTNIKCNDTLVFEKAHYGLMIKKVKYIKNNSYFVEGTTPLSIDSRNFGTLTHQELKYKVLCKI